MKRTKIVSMSILLLLFVSNDLLADCCDSCGCHSLYVPQSTGANIAREMFDPTMAPTTKFDDTSFASRIVFEGERSVRNVRIADCLLGGSNTLNFVGEMQDPSGASLRFSRVIIAENLGLSPDTNQSVTFCPSISNMILDLQFLWQCDVFLPGMFLNVNIPITFTRWHLNTKCNILLTDGNAQDTDCASTCGCCEVTQCSDRPCACETPDTPIPAGCVGSTLFDFPELGGIDTIPAETTTHALSGNFLFGDMQTRWKFGKFRLGKQKDTRVADIDVILGYNFVSCEDYHFGLYLQTVAPTGTRINRCFAEYLFTPVIGNGHFWEFGAGWTGHWDFWRKGDCHQLSWWFQGNLTHLFNDCQVRTFDFKENGCLSRYMLLKEFNAQNEYAGQLINAINFTTRNVNVSIPLKGNAAVKLIYRFMNVYFGLGYEIYGRSAEKLCIKNGFVDTTLDGRRFGIKGCSPVQGTVYLANSVDNNVIAALSPSSPFTVNGTQSNARIGQCGNTDNALTLLQLQDGPADFGAVVADACANTTEVIFEITELTDVTAAEGSYAPGATVVVSNVDGSFSVDGTPAPVILTGAISELNCDSARVPKQISNKVFGTVDYILQSHCYNPFIGIAAEGTFGQADDCCVLNKWGLWLRGGFSW